MSPSPATLRAQHGEALHALPGRCLLDADTTYELRGEPGVVEAICARLPRRSVDRWGSRARITFGTSIGLFDLGTLGLLEVASGKWTAASFDALLADLTRRAAALPFRAGSGSALPYERAPSADRDLLWHQFVYLRHALSDAAPGPEHLASGLAALLADPHRRHLARSELVPTALADLVAPDVLLDVAAGLYPTVEVARGRFRLADRLGGRMPTELRTQRLEETFDTPENRFVLDLLQRCVRLLDRVEGLSLSGAVRADLARLRAQLAPVLAADLWRQVGRLTHLSAASTVLQGRRGYREAFTVSERLRQASRVPVDAPTLRALLETRNAADLYELWVFFAVVDAVSAVRGRPDRADALAHTELQVGVPWRYRVRWACGTEATYNRTFSPGASPGTSWSVPLRPDVVLSVPSADGPVAHAIDAKFKLTWAREPDLGSGLHASYARNDVAKMHAYRDALRGVRTAWVAYPGEVDRVWSGDDGQVGAVGVMAGREEGLGRLVAGLLAGTRDLRNPAAS